MTTQTITTSAHADLVEAYETLREAVVSSGTSAAAPLDGRRLLTEGLLCWGRYYTAYRAQASALNLLGRGGASQGLHTRSEPPQAAVVSLMATMALHSIDHPETLL